ncbi:MAG: hypothetical protein JNM94_11965 [Phycisphaerae bacterium]|nr:hypothetical protein [Phycisphaerae bacterium]
MTGDDSALNFELGGGGEFRLGWWGGHGALRLEDGASAALSSLNVGASGSGELVMSGGATLTTTCCGYVGSGLGSVATATLSGLGTKWTGVGVDAVTAGEFGSTGSIAVLDGAAIEAEGFQLANEGGLSGSLLVSGRGSVVHTGGFSTAGVPDASAEFDIVDAGLLEIEGFGFLSFAGSTAGTIDGAGSRLDCDADFVVGSGEGGDALVTVSNGGTLETGGILYALRGLQDVNPAALVVDGAGSKVLAGGRLYVRGDKPGTSVIVRHGAQASLFSGATLGEFGSPCELRAESGAQIVSLGGLSVGAGAGVAPDVKFSIRDPGTSVTFEASPCYVDAGLVECVDAAVFSALELNVGWGGEADLHVSGSAFVGVFGRLTLGNIGNGEGTLHVSGAGSLVSCGSDLVSGFDGTGHISISEGAFVATAGNYYQELDSSLSVEFGLDSSAAPLFVLGTANLGGTLSVQFLRGAELEVGETRLIIDAGAVNGVFATTSLPPQHEVSYGPAGVSIVRVASVLGDLNNDGLVGGSDLAELLGAWGNSGAADLNGDGVVDAADLALLLGAWSGA